MRRHGRQRGPERDHGPTRCRRLGRGHADSALTKVPVMPYDVEYTDESESCWNVLSARAPLDKEIHVAGNHLESLVAEWYELRGYFIRRNVKVGKRPNGGHECELDVVGFHPEQRSLVQIEPSLDAHNWTKREARYKKKFDAGRKYIPGLFPGMAVPKHIDQIALFVYGGGKSRERIAGGRVVFIRDFMAEIRASIRHRRVARAAIPEGLPLLRTLQFAAEYWEEKKTG